MRSLYGWMNDKVSALSLSCAQSHNLILGYTMKMTSSMHADGSSNAQF